MAQSSHPSAPMENPTAVVSPHFTSPHPVDLNIMQKVNHSDGHFTVSDDKGNVLFQVKGKHISLHDRHALLDAAGTPILTFQKKMLSAHHKWVVFRGNSLDSKDIVFSAKQSSLIQFKTSLDVFLGSHEKEDVCDFKVKGSWFDRSCTIYARDGTTVVAQMHKKHTVQSIALEKDTFAVTVYPNVDQAFVVALVMILHEINIENHDEA